MSTSATRDPLVPAANLRLALLGLPTVASGPDNQAELVSPLLARQRELSRRQGDRLPPVDERIEAFLESYLDGIPHLPRLPRRTLTLDVPGLARTLSLPATSDRYASDLITSYRLVNGVLHNPRNDRRTTAGVFHVVEGGLPIPDDKKAVPREAFAALLTAAFAPPAASLELPITSDQAAPAACFVSLLLRPLVVVGVPGRTRERRMETRFIVPGSMVANLDFVEGTATPVTRTSPRMTRRSIRWAGPGTPAWLFSPPTWSRRPSSLSVCRTAAPRPIARYAMGCAGATPPRPTTTARPSRCVRATSAAS